MIILGRLSIIKSVSDQPTRYKQVPRDAYIDIQQSPGICGGFRSNPFVTIGESRLVARDYTGKKELLDGKEDHSLQEREVRLDARRTLGRNCDHRYFNWSAPSRRSCGALGGATYAML